MAEYICDRFSEGACFQLTPEAAGDLVLRIPPEALVTQLGQSGARELLDFLEPCDAMAMAAWTDRQHYLHRILDVIEKEARPEWFHEAPLRPVLVNLDHISGAVEIRGTAALSRLAGRVTVGNYQKGWGGDLPKLWFFLKAIKSLVGVELFSSAWRRFAEEGIDFGQRVAASIRGHWGRRVLSAHYAFENGHQRILADRVGRFAERIALEEPDKGEAAELLGAAMSVYHLSITLPDATFVPLSAWTWASYGHRGGVGVPTPLSSLVERDWSTRDFLVAYMRAAGLGDSAAVDRKIHELMGKGREHEDLREHLLGVSADPDALFADSTGRLGDRPAGRLRRPVDGPILEPVPGHPWESRYVLNAAAVRLGGVVHILYRAYGEDEVSRIGLAWSRDGIHIDGRSEEPVFSPAHPTESAGCEDPRVAVLGDRMYMLYTAWDRAVPQIAMASIPVRAFLERRFDAWERHGLGFPGLSNKDAVLYPETFGGKHVLYHRIDPNIWISYLDDLGCPWPRTGQRILAGPRPGMMWDGVKIGAGAQPLKTTRGWLNIYHGVDYERSYRLGVILTALDDPSRILYRSPNPVLEPETEFEIGRSGDADFWVPHVVFSCGAVPAEDKAVLDVDDEVLVYYGAADTAIGVASARVGDLVPILGTAR